MASRSTAMSVAVSRQRSHGFKKYAGQVLNFPIDTANFLIALRISILTRNFHTQGVLSPKFRIVNVNFRTGKKSDSSKFGRGHLPPPSAITPLTVQTDQSMTMTAHTFTIEAITDTRLGRRQQQHAKYISPPDSSAHSLTAATSLIHHYVMRPSTCRPGPAPGAAAARHEYANTPVTSLIGCRAPRHWQAANSCSPAPDRIITVES